jgi:hypothetical protein
VGLFMFVWMRVPGCVSELMLLTMDVSLYGWVRLYVRGWVSICVCECACMNGWACG